MENHNHFTPLEQNESNRLKNIVTSTMEAYDHLSLEYKKLDDSFGDLQKENKELKRKLDICKVTLEFYGDQKNWMGYHRQVDVIHNDSEPAKSIEDDFDIFLGGKRARQALKELGE